MSRVNIDLGLLMLRIGAFTMFFHGIKKMLDGHDGVRQGLIAHGLPEFLWLGVPVAEVLAPILILLGVFTRLGGLLYVVVMIIAIYFTHWGNLFGINEYTGALNMEANLLFLSGGLCLFFAGGGKYAVYRPKNHWLR